MLARGTMGIRAKEGGLLPSGLPGMMGLRLGLTRQRYFGICLCRGRLARAWRGHLALARPRGSAAETAAGLAGETPATQTNAKVALSCYALTLQRGPVTKPGMSWLGTGLICRRA
jgi:hypothetical protein